MRYSFVAVTAILCFGLVLFGPQAAAGAAEGFELFISCVFPSLFPFFVCVALLKGLGVFGVKSGRAGAAILKIFASIIDFRNTHRADAYRFGAARKH